MSIEASGKPARRWRLDIAYDGSGFHGWASQEGLRTVQGTLEEWISTVLRTTDPVQLTVAGRTDAGVHARGQVAHMDLAREYDATHLASRLLKVIPNDVVVHQVQRAPEGFDARFAAIWRHYVYRLWDADSQPDPLLRGHVARVRERLDLDALNQAATLLIGLHDFAPFCRRNDFGTSIRHLTDLHAVRRDDETGMIECHVTADAFCHSMVRSLVGALWAVGAGRRDEAWLGKVAAHPVRHNDVYVMPAHGLCLEEVGYPPDDQLAARAAQARSFRKPQEIDQ
ncbi:tRNA pseudouridine(38-40) synthase TruA [Propionimicrobium sp. PCR01-08-3]|uniref:tRNA pseudouridine(38-40) synthase TruA n=1 Tax=Propionimicrobium sp. PCR01-08-3 TaxID=3052086 RepID=UPI00255D141D|nr:tRNA pseudouridine(38-40) synthase TruA [Propionimicrobium sp. PCR01-08-3]WIY83230.1 tRNA pseudouridine(38-40) synthase TruA [Propionimicrobium sp. PCR01-08-3]